MSSLFEKIRLSLDEAIALTAENMRFHGSHYRHWTLAYSGGKDSSATLAAIVYLLENNLIEAPETLTVLYSDTRLELVPLHFAAMRMIAKLREKGIDAHVVMPPMEDRYFVYMLGRGIPPPTNTFRWCTSQLKIEPMQKAIEEKAVAAGFGKMVWDARFQKFRYVGFGKEKLLTITGVRQGESAARDARISMSCTKNGAECGQGWLQNSPKDGLNDTLAPILHWRVCHVWDYLMFYESEHGLPTRDIAETYGINEDGSNAENGTRTGCMGCNLTEKDTALDNLIVKPNWQYLAPLKQLKEFNVWLRQPHQRHRIITGKRAGQMGALSIEARREGLEKILAIQAEVNYQAVDFGKPTISLIDDQEQFAIEQMLKENTFPNGWTGSEPLGDATLTKFYNGITQPSFLDGVLENK